MKRINKYWIILICLCISSFFVSASAEADDHGNRYSTATAISTGGGLWSGSIETGGDVDYFSFYATSGCTYVIETSDLGSGSDTYIYLYSTNGTTEIDHDDDGGAGLASKIEWEATSSGTYYIKVRHYRSSSGTGTYKISVTSPHDGSDAVNLTDGQSHSGSLSSTGDTDMYSISVSAGGTLIVTLDGPSSGADFDLYVRIGSQPTLSSYDDRGYSGSADETCSVTASSSAPVYIMVRSYWGSGSYSILVSTDGGDSDIIPLPDGQSHSDSLSSTGDTDMYSISVSAGDTLTVTLDGPSSGADFDLYVRIGVPPTLDVYEEGGIGYSSSADEMCTVTASSSGTAYIMVRSYWGSGSYSIVSEVEEEWSTTNDYVAIAAITPNERTILATGQEVTFDALINYTLASRDQAILELAIYAFGDEAVETGRIGEASQTVYRDDGSINLTKVVTIPVTALSVKAVANLRLDETTIIKRGEWSDPYPTENSSNLGEMASIVGENALAFGASVGASEAVSRSLQWLFSKVVGTVGGLFTSFLLEIPLVGAPLSYFENYSGTLNEEGWVYIDSLYMNSECEQLGFKLTCSSSSDDIEIVVITPSGTLLKSIDSHGQLDSGVTDVLGIENPEEGLWEVMLHGIDVQNGEYELEIEWWAW